MKSNFAKEILKARKNNLDMVLSQKEIDILLDVINRNDEKMNDKIILSKVQPECDNCKFKKENKKLLKENKKLNNLLFRFTVKD